MSLYNRAELLVTDALASSRSLRLKRGGARTRADRQSRQLTKAQCETLIQASIEAAEIDQPLNRYITIAWGHSGLDPLESVKATGEWIALARDHLRNQGFGMPWIWVQEYGPYFGAHCHMLLHVAPQISPLFRGRPYKWAQQVLKRRGLQYLKGTTQTQKLMFGDDIDVNIHAYLAALSGKVHYMLKCAPTHLEREFGLVGLGHKPWDQKCTVYGKRAARWQRKRTALNQVPTLT